MTRLLAKHRPKGILIEACRLGGGVRDRCLVLGLTGLVANTTSAAGTFQPLQRKTDKEDALRLAQV